MLEPQPQGGAEAHQQKGQRSVTLFSDPHSDTMSVVVIGIPRLTKRRPIVGKVHFKKWSCNRVTPPSPEAEKMSN